MLADPSSSFLTSAAVSRVVAGGSLRNQAPSLEELRAIAAGAVCVVYGSLAGDASGTTTGLLQVMRFVRCAEPAPVAGSTVRVAPDANWDLGRVVATGFLVLDREADGSWRLLTPPRSLSSDDERALGWRQ